MWVKKLWHIYTIELYENIRNLAETWVGREAIMLNELSLKVKKKQQILSHIYGIRESKRTILDKSNIP